MKAIKKEVYTLFKMTANLNLYMSLCEPKLDRLEKEIYAIDEQVDVITKAISENHKKVFEELVK